MKHGFEATDNNSATTTNQSGLKHRYLPSLDLDLVDATARKTIDVMLESDRTRAFFVNAHGCNTRHRCPDYAKAVGSADMLLPNGVGVELAAKMSGKSLTQDLNGSDFIPGLLLAAAKQGKSVFLFGSKPGTADAAANQLVHKIPHLRIAGTRDGFSGAKDPAKVILDINESGADIVLVALGVPRQEIWLDTYADQLNAPLTLGVGALFDLLAGTVSRAPKVIRRARLEWAWRLAQEPRRLAGRYLAGNVTFLVRAVSKTLLSRPVASAAQRMLDVSVSFAAMVVLAPVLAVTALAIKADSRGPAIFRQTRIGRNGVPFTMLKFRSMHINAEHRRSALLDSSDRKGICFKSRSDPRTTRVGRLIRRLSVDELPQILNVLRGEMSIVGPRPALPSEVAVYPRRALGRLSVKPGITGVWQVSGRANISFDKMIDMDLSYAAHRTLLMDLALILKTFRAVVSGRGAY